MILVRTAEAAREVQEQLQALGMRSASAFETARPAALVRRAVLACPTSVWPRGHCCYVLPALRPMRPADVETSSSRPSCLDPDAHWCACRQQCGSW